MDNNPYAQENVSSRDGSKKKRKPTQNTSNETIEK
jgi:hypothetical protein